MRNSNAEFGSEKVVRQVRKRYSNKDIHSVNPMKLLENAGNGQEAIVKKLKLRIKNSGSKDSTFFGRIRERNRSKARMEKLTKSSQ